MPIPPASTLAAIASTCTPDPLEGEKLASFFVKTDEARDEKTHLRQRLIQIFNQDDIARRVLVYGHRGCGKSTELNCFKEGVGDQWFIVDFSVKDYLPPVGVKAEDILLAMAVALVDRLDDPSAGRGEERPRITISTAYLKKVHEFFIDLTITSKEDRDAQLRAAAEAGVTGASLWSLILPMKVGASSELSFGSRRKPASSKSASAPAISSSP